MLIIAILLLIAGALLALFGLRLFRLLLPLAGLVAGIMVGFSGIQEIFGVGVISTTIAVIFALFAGLLLALLSYFFFELSIVILAASIGASLFVLIGTTLGLSEGGFVMFLLGLSGLVAGAYAATAYKLTHGFVIGLTSIVGSTIALAGLLLMVGSVELAQVEANGIISTVAGVVDGSILWILTLIGATAVASVFQMRTRPVEIDLDELYEVTMAQNK